MTRLGIVSDSHDRQVWLERWLERCRQQRYDAVFHLGDLHSDARWLERQLGMPLIAVAGNCDPLSRQARMARACFEGHRIIAVHGHLQNVKYGYDNLSYYAQEQGASIALFGHTHRPCTLMLGGVLLLNPGALMNGCYAELELDGERAVPRLFSFLDDDR